MANNNKHTGPNVPALRFPEFSGEWKKMSLQDCCSDFSYGLNAPAKAYDGVNKYIRITDIDENTSVYKSDDPVSPDGLLSDEYLVNENDILFARTGASTGKTYLYNQNDGRLFYAGFLIKANVNNNCDPYFIFSQTKTQSYRRWVEIMSTRSGQPGINSQEYASYPLYVPPKEEQEKIALLLRGLDKRILVQSKIIEELKTLRGALVDTYINDGNNNENQTIMSLGAYGCFVRGLTYSSVDVTDNTATTGVVRSNNLEYGSPVDIKADLVYVTKKPSPEQMLVNGDIVICMANGSSSLVGKASNYQELCRNMTVGAFCGIYRGTHPLTKWIFMSSAYCKAVANAIQGGNGAIANLHAEDILSMCFAVPSDYKTITELGKLLSLFDEKLHAAEEQLVRFIEQKKYFLFKMFI